MDPTFIPIIKLYDVAENKMVSVICDQPDRGLSAWVHQKNESGEWKQVTCPIDDEDKEHVQNAIAKLNRDLGHIRNSPG